MNRTIATLLLAAVAGSSMADDITIDPTPFVSTKSRAEVRAELERFRSAGVNPWSMTYNPLKYFQGSRTRAEVTAEYVDSRGEVAAITSEDSGSMYLTQMAARERHGQHMVGRIGRNAR